MTSSPILSAPRRCLYAIVMGITVSGCKAITSDLEPPADSIARVDIIALSSSAPSISANGASTVRLSARIPNDAKTRTVTFNTTAGVFLESGSKEVKSFATLDAVAGKRIATTELRSDTTAARAIVRATMGEYYDTVSVQFIKP